MLDFKAKNIEKSDYHGEGKSDSGQQVVSLAYRPRQGPTGGPGGVLFVQENILGNNLDGISLDYEYKPPVEPSVNNKINQIANLLGFLPRTIKAAFWAWSLAKKRTDARFIVHEPESALGLALANAKYILIYHQQGSLVCELKGIDIDLRFHQVMVLHLIEAWVFRKALRVYFPSIGAQKVYLETAKLNRANSFCGGEPIYNTILTDDEEINQEDLEIINNLSQKELVFLSVGSLYEAKGIDRIPQFLTLFKSYHQVDFTWIVVGQGVLESKIKASIFKGNLEENTQLITHKRLGHPAILKLMEIANCYIMLHRRSIFDFATLEAMRAGCAVVLSDIGGNPEFNINNNVILVKENNMEAIVQELSFQKLKELGTKNQKIFQDRFSTQNFKTRYKKAILKLIETV
ncbi:MAG TPA: hypothetical protein DCF68_09870 [Cyanothece sp. UBA12306]|nr:hypothetical protein [Cyanothece sp. UBA12306]